ncbi:hypothetical protein CPC08DRAFT_763597 [Agrocybe pediades]|nr:hypothetical protein CPC08DRAFT_763597 [Agrocybe pediades]
MPAQDTAEWRKWRNELFVWLNEETNLPQRAGQKTTKKRKLVTTIKGRIMDPIKQHKTQLEARRAALLVSSDNTPPTTSDPVLVASATLGTTPNSLVAPAKADCPPQRPSHARTEVPITAPSDSASAPLTASGSVHLEATKAPSSPLSLPIASSDSTNTSGIPAGSRGILKENRLLN